MSHKNDWIIYFINKNYKIDFDKIYENAITDENIELCLLLINNNYISSNSESDIFKLFSLSDTSIEMLIWLKDNKMNLNHIFNPEEISDIFEYHTDMSLLLENNIHYGNNNIVDNNDYSDLSLSLLLQLLALSEENMTLFEWLLENEIEKSSHIFNIALYNLSELDNIKMLHSHGFQCNEYSIEKAIRGGCVDTLKYIINNMGCILTLSYELCELAYYNQRPTMLKYLTKPLLDNNLIIDNRYIIRSIKDKNYEIFYALYKNYPEIVFYNFNDETTEITMMGSIILNKRLNNYIKKAYNIKSLKSIKF